MSPPRTNNETRDPHDATGRNSFDFFLGSAAMPWMQCQTPVLTGVPFTGWWLTYPCEKYESQLGWWHSQYIWKDKKSLKPPARFKQQMLSILGICWDIPPSLDGFYQWTEGLPWVNLRKSIIGCLKVSHGCSKLGVPPKKWRSVICIPVQLRNTIFWWFTIPCWPQMFSQFPWILNIIQYFSWGRVKYHISGNQHPLTSYF